MWMGTFYNHLVLNQMTEDVGNILFLANLAIKANSCISLSEDNVILTYNVIFNLICKDSVICTNANYLKEKITLYARITVIGLVQR